MQEIKSYCSASDLFNTIANEYEELILKGHAHYCQILRLLAKRHDIMRGSILDVGCGPGNLKETLGSGFEFTGIDVATEMLNIAYKRDYETINNKIEQALPEIEDSSYDYVFAISSLYFLKEGQEAVEHINRIAKRGWVITIEHIPEHHAKVFEQLTNSKLYSHNINFAMIGYTPPKYLFPAWLSPSTDDVVDAELVAKFEN